MPAIFALRWVPAWLRRCCQYFTLPARWSGLRHLHPRYTISHFREPVDIASSSFGENATVFGGKGNLFKGLNNVIKQYHPAMIGVASTCLAETIGEDVAAQIKEFYLQSDGWCPELIFAPTPSYVGSHYDGFTGQSSRLSQHWQGPEKRSKILIFCLI